MSFTELELDVADRAARQVGHVTVDTLPGSPAQDATVAAVTTALGTDGSTPPALPGGATGVRGWLRLLYAAITGTLTVQWAGQSVSVSNLPATQPVSGTVSVGNFPATQPVSAASLPLPSGAATDASVQAVEQRLPAALDGGSLNVADVYTAGEVLPSQAGAGAVLTFTLARQEDLIWILSKGGVSFADPFGGTPANGTGIYCDDGVPQPVTVRVGAGGAVKVWAPGGVTVYVWAYGS